ADAEIELGKAAFACQADAFVEQEIAGTHRCEFVVGKGRELADDAAADDAVAAYRPQFPSDLEPVELEGRSFASERVGEQAAKERPDGRACKGVGDPARRKLPSLHGEIAIEAARDLFRRGGAKMPKPAERFIFPDLPPVALAL